MTDPERYSYKEIVSLPGLYVGDRIDNLICWLDHRNQDGRDMYCSPDVVVALNTRGRFHDFDVSDSPYYCGVWKFRNRVFVIPDEIHDKKQEIKED